MAEFPNFGRHCNVDDCHLLDFLPVRCDACRKDFCATHYFYDAHQCNSAYKKDVQVPVCPLCGKLVPVARGEQPDKRVSDHIDSDCKSDPAIALKGKIYTNRCSERKCKKRELVPIKCDQCGQNFCLRHRFPADHDCIGMKSERPMSKAALAALRRNNSSDQNERNMKESSSYPSLPTSSMSEDEILARALQESLNNFDGYASPEERDRAFAEELQRIEYQEQPQRVPSNSVRSGCAIA